MAEYLHTQVYSIILFYAIGSKIVEKKAQSICSVLVPSQPNAPNGKFSTLDFAAVSVRIHVEFQNNERGKEKDRHWTGVAAACNID